MSLRYKLAFIAIILLILFALSDLSGTSEICAYYGFNLPECK